MMEEEYYIERTIQRAIEEKRNNFEGTDEEFESFFKNEVPTIVEEIIRNLTSELFYSSVSEDNQLKSREKKVRKSIKNKYKLGIRLLESFIDINTQIGVLSYSKYREVFNNIDDLLKLDTLISIHARALQISNEIRTLVVNGYPDGAMSRWRTLHELSIVFLVLYDNNHKLIRMYNDYFVVEQWKKAREYNEVSELLHWESIESDKIKEMEDHYKELKQIYGAEFCQGYGWTIDILPKGRRNIRELEKLVDLNHLRPVYSWASENVHSGVSGINSRLGLDENQRNFFLIASNNQGLLDPVQYMANTMALMSKTLLDMEDSILNKIFIEVLKFIQKEMIQQFDDNPKG